MNITVYDINNNQLNMPSPVSLNILREEGVPADNPTAVFIYEKTMPELKSICVTDNEETIFSGVVDEQLIYCKDNVSLFRIICRSMAAPLLDSEAYPRTYVLPSIDVIFEKCLKPYGIKGYKGNCDTFSTAFTVDKGMSNWQVAEDFCTRYLNIFPRIDTDGYIDIRPNINGESIKFSNLNGNIYSDISKNIKRHNQISHVIARLKVNDDYNYVVKNDDAISHGIYNVRYLNCAELPSEYLSIADKIIANSRNNRFEYTLQCPYELLNALGRRAEIDDPIIGNEKALVICSVDYYMSSNGEYTEVKLRKEL